MLQGVFLALVCFLLGLVWQSVFKREDVWVRVSLSLLLGAVTVTLGLFLTVWLFGTSSISIVSFLFLILTGSLLYLRYHLKYTLSSIRELSIHTWQHRGWWFILIILFSWLFGRAMFVDQNGALIAGDRLVWTDWPTHMALISNFAWGDNFLPMNPLFSGVPLIYPFFSDFISGILIHLGSSIPMALFIPGILLSLLFCALFIVFAYFLLEKVTSETHRPKIIMAALVISLFWGGLAWVEWLKEAAVNETTFVETLLNPPREYTFWQDKGYWFFTFIYSEILPQRAFLFGLPIFFSVVILLYLGLEKKITKYLIIAGVLAGVTPFFHSHTFMALWFYSITIFSLLWLNLLLNVLGHPGKRVTSASRIRNWHGFWTSQNDDFKIKSFLGLSFAFFLPFSLLTAIQLPLFLHSNTEIPFVFGWTKGKENFVLFWLKNTGLFLPLFFFGIMKGPAKQDPASQEKFPKLVKIFGWATLSLFIIPNLWQFARWGYDNLKLFTYWYLLSSIFVAFGLYEIWKMKWLGKLLAIVLFFTLTLSGFVEVGRLVDTKKVQLTLWSKADQELAVEIRNISEPQSVFLTSANHDHPVSALSGRRIVMGYPGTAWSWGIDGTTEREQDMKNMFAGGLDAKSLWKKYGVNYIMVGDRERWFAKELNEAFIAENSELVLEMGNTRVYKVK